MAKNYFLLIFSLLLVATYSQQGLNQPRKLTGEENETVLLGFDNYTALPLYYTHNDSFNTYFLLKNWVDEFDSNKYKNFTLDTIINYRNTSLKSDNIKFICEYNATYENNSESSKKYRIVKYLCNANSTSKDIVKRINITNNFSNFYLNNDTQIDYVSSSAEALQRNLIALRDKAIFDKGKNAILLNATFISKSPGTFKLKGDDIYIINDNDYDYESKKAQLITMSNGIAKNISCTFEEKKDENDEEYYYYLTPNGAEEIPNADLQYAVVYFPVKDKTLILDFKDRSNTKVRDNKVYKMSSGGLSTGGIIAVTIPTCAVLLGVAGLSFFLSRKNATPPPQIKTMNNMNMQNNTMGVIATSSEAVIHQ